MIKVFLFAMWICSGDTLVFTQCSDRRIDPIRKIDPSEILGAKAVILDCNRLTDLKDFDLRSVEYLRLRSNPLTSLDSHFPLESLVHLDINQTEIYDFPSSLCSCTHLKRIDNSDGFWSKVPACFSKLESLEILNVGFVEFDSSINFGKSKLRNLPLFFSSDQSTNVKILRKVGRLAQLTRLSISRFDLPITELSDLPNKNQIEVLSIGLSNDSTFCDLIKEVSSWESLKTLEVEMNEGTVPDCLQSLNNVENLILKAKKNTRVVLPKHGLDGDKIRSVYDFKNFKDFEIDKSKITIIVPGDMLTYRNRYDRNGFMVKRYRDPMYID